MKLLHKEVRVLSEGDATHDVYAYLQQRRF